jgi:hypothetical protein
LEHGQPGFCGSILPKMALARLPAGAEGHSGMMTRYSMQQLQV